MNNKPVKRCSICGHQATGFNFKGSFVSCNACKQFFYRFANKFEELKCIKKGNCIIDSAATRNDCRKCRLNKCFAIGMKNLKNNFDNKNQNNIKRENNEKLNKAKFKNIFEKLIENEANREIVVVVQSAKPGNRVETLSSNLSCLSLTEQESARISEVHSALSDMEDERDYLVAGQAKDFADMFKLPIEPHTRQILSFCHLMLPFNALSNAEQLNVLKQYFCEVMFVKIAFGYDRQNDGFYVLKDETEKQTLFFPYSCVSKYNHKNLVTDIRKWVLGLGDLMENDKIIRDLILALLLFSHQNENNTIPEIIRYNYIAHGYLLKRYLEHKHQSAQRAHARFNRIMSILGSMDRVHQFVHHFLVSETTFEDQIPDIVFEIHNLV